MPKLQPALTVILVLFSFCTNAQRFMPGYILQNGDTIRGEIDNKAWDTNPTRVQFRTPSGLTGYTTTEIEGFGIFGLDHYRRRFVRMDMNPVDLTQVRRNIRDSVRTATVFLRLLVDGNRVDLYEFEDFKPHYFIEETQGTAVELIYSVSFDETSGTVNTYNGFHDQLKRLITGLNDAENLTRRVNGLRYQANDISKFIRSLDAETGNYISPDQANTRLKSQFFAGGGALFGEMRFTGEETQLNSLRFDSEVSYVASAGVDLYLSRDRQSFFFRTELVVSAFKSHGEGSTKSDGGLNQGYQNSYDLEQFNLGPAISFNLSFVRGKSVFIYGGLGYRYNFSNTKSTFRSINRLTGDTSIRKNYPEPNDAWGNMYLKIGGIVNRRVEAAVAFFLAGSYIDYGFTTLRSHPVTVQLFYRFGKSKKAGE